MTKRVGELGLGPFRNVTCHALRSSCKLAPSSRVGWSPEAKFELAEAAFTDDGLRLRRQVRYKKIER